MLRACLADRLLYCPTCRGVVDGCYRDSPVHLAEAFCERDGWVLHGLLACDACPARYPIIDGIPILVRGPGDYLQRMEDAALWREDLPPALTRWLLEQYTEQREPGWRRQMLAIYGTAFRPPPHSDDPFQRSLNEQIERSRAFLRERQMMALQDRDACLAVELGCGMGASSLALAEGGARVLAVDYDFAALRVLARLLQTGRAELPFWRYGGTDYQTTQVRLPEASRAAEILPIAADALAPPFAADTFDLATCYNLVDNVAEPVVLLRQLAAILKPQGRLQLSCPYDWVAHCTPPANQLGGGSVCGEDDDPAAVLRRLLAGQLPERAPELRFRIEYERQAVPWIIRRHARSYHVFLCHYLEAVAETPGG